MDQVRLGNSGLHVSRVCLGMMSYAATDATEKPWSAWALDIDAAEPIVRRAVEGGVTFFDSADIYSAGASEVATGRLLPQFLSRQEMVVATKVWGQISPGPNGRGLSRKHILDGIDASLTRLNMDYVDLYQVHAWDASTPLEETMQALNDVVRSGKARYIGACNFRAWQLAKANAIASANGWAPFVSVQNHYNLLTRDDEREVLPLCEQDGIGYLSWSSLARGWLSGTRTRAGVSGQTARTGNDPFSEILYGRSEDYDVIDALTAVAAGRGVSPVAVALAWLFQVRGLTSTLVGLTRPAQFDDVPIATELALSADEVALLKKPYQPRPARDW